MASRFKSPAMILSGGGILSARLSAELFIAEVLTSCGFCIAVDSSDLDRTSVHKCVVPSESELAALPRPDCRRPSVPLSSSCWTRGRSHPRGPAASPIHCSGRDRDL